MVTATRALLVLALLPNGSAAALQEQVSRFGAYSGYSEELFDGWQRSSEYVEMRDGVKLAVDVFRPTLGELVTDPLPAIWTHTRYQRASEVNGQQVDILWHSPPLQALVRHGYVVLAVEVRGSGASFGTWQGLFTEEETRDAYDVTEWIAAQPWCDGNVGMYGASYLGITQYMAASTHPPHLKALFPEVAAFDFYDVVHGGGIYRFDLVERWGDIVAALDGNGASPRLPPGAWSVMKARPVDADRDRSWLGAALATHRANRPVAELYEPLRFRDSVDPRTGKGPYREWNPSTYRAAIDSAGVPIYHLAGWLDVFVRDALLWYANLAVPQKLVIGPWSHLQRHGLDLDAEYLRWFDRWLKGIDNGVMDEPPIHYYVMGAPPERAWRATRTWPLAEERRTRFYFQAGPSGTSGSAIDGTLAPDAPAESGRDVYTVDPDATSGKPSRWSNAYGDGGPGFQYPDLAAMDARGLTYTSAALARDTEVTGHPVAHLWLASTAADADVFVFLEEVEADGSSRYVTEGSLRASLRATGEPPHARLGLPYQRCFAADARDLPEEPVELVLDLLPTSNLFDAGHRIRLTLLGADALNARTPRLDPPPRLTLLRERERGSYVELPVIPGKDAR